MNERRDVYGLMIKRYEYDIVLKTLRKEEKQ